nr:M56 family metallopeptidase [uncultured Undibacterium sp.]
MNTINTLTPHILSWLLNYVVHSTILLGLASLAQYYGALQSRRLAEIVWRFALLGGLVTASLQLGIQLNLQTSSTIDLVSATQQIIAPPKPTASYDSGNLVGVKEEISSTPIAKPASIEATIYPVSNIVLDEPSNNEVILLPANLQDSISVLILTWLIYSTFVVAKITFSVYRLNRFAKAMPIISRDDLDALLRQNLPNLDNSKRLRVSSTFNSPFVCPNGVICLPAWVLEQNNQSLCHAMLHHEIQHIIRRDSAWRIVQELKKSVFFFQILNRAAEKQLTLLAEIDCDRIAVKANGVDTFAEALVRCAEMAVASKHPAFAIPMAKSTSLLQRIEFILDEDIMNKQTAREQNKLSSASSLALGLIAIASLSGVCYAMPTLGFAEVSIAKPHLVPAMTTVQKVSSLDEPSKLDPTTSIESQDHTEVVPTIAVQTNDNQPKNDASLAEQPATANAVSTTQTNEFEKAQAAYANKNFADALQIFRDLAKRGHTEAQFMAGDMLWRGEGNAVDPETAIAMLTQAANQGHSKAQQYVALFAERAKRQTEITFYTQQFDGGKLKWTEKVCERPIVSSMLPSAKEYKSLIDKLNTNLNCYNNYVANLKQSLFNEDYLNADLRHLMRKDEIEQTKQLVQNIYFDMGAQALQHSQQMLVEFNKNNDIWRSEIKAQRGRHIEFSMDMERDRFARMERRPVEIETGVRSVTTSSNPNVAPVVNTK